MNSDHADNREQPPSTYHKIRSAIRRGFDRVSAPFPPGAAGERFDKALEDASEAKYLAEREDLKNARRVVK